MTEEKIAMINRHDPVADLLEQVNKGKNNVMKFKDEMTASEIDKLIKDSKGQTFYVICNAYYLGYQRGAERTIE